MAKMKIKTGYFLLFVMASLIVVSCKREDTYYRTTNGYNKKNSGNQTNNSNSIISCGNTDMERHFISVEYAYELINNYQQAAKKSNALCSAFDDGGWVYSETFPADAIQRILNQEGCCKFRIYNGLDSDNRLHLVMTGVNESGYDILSCNAVNTSGSSDSCGGINTLELIVEMGAPCPQACAGTYTTTP